MKGPDKNSNRSKKRASRGFRSLEESSRKHKRMAQRLKTQCIIGANHHGSNGTVYKPGQKIMPPNQGKEKVWLETAGGSVNYH